jgi:poly(3-hydroxybutyrate) depolymerase
VSSLPRGDSSRTEQLLARGLTNDLIFPRPKELVRVCSGIPDTLADWARHNGCDPNVILDDPPGPLSTMRYEGCDNNADVRLIRINGLGHTWAREFADPAPLRRVRLD